MAALRQAYQIIKDRHKYGYGARDLARHFGRNLPALAMGGPRAAAALFDHVANPNHAGREFWLDTIIEPVPNPESRITLSGERDALGLSLARVDLRLTEQDKDTFLRTQRLLYADLAAGGAAQVDGSAPDPQWPDEVFWCAHHMGTTRMSEDPKRGVVDPDCRVHGVGNLYIAGSSVFPTVGSDIPTMTIVAMALRLSDHLALTLSQPRVPEFTLSGAARA
jgi:choline dehydrogenase-like flavoprotein